MKLILKEAPFEDKFNEELDINNTELEVKSPLELPIEDHKEDTVPSIELDNTNTALVEFINSDELNELRDVFIEYDLYNDVDISPKLLLLNNNLVVIAQEGNEEPVDDNTTFLYCLGDDDDEFSLIPLPNSIDSILSNSAIIQYSPSNISDVHDKVVQLFMEKLTGEDIEEQKDSITTPIEEPEEDLEDSKENLEISKSEEEVDEDE